MLRHPILSALPIAVMFAATVRAVMDSTWPRHPGDMFGNEVIALVALPFLWFLSAVETSAIAWRRGVTDAADRGNRA